MQLGQFPAEADPAVCTKSIPKIFQCRYQLVGRFIENHGPLLFLQALQMLPAALLGSGQETFETEPPRCLTGDAQGSNGGAGAGNGADGDAGSGWRCLPDFRWG